MTPPVLSLAGRPWRRCAVAAALVLFAAAGARAQLGIEVKLDRTGYFAFEPVVMTVTLRNNSGNPLLFSNHKPLTGFVRIKVTDADGIAVPTLAPVPNLGENLILGIGETKNLTLRLDTVFNVQRNGTYLASALAGHDRLGEDYRSEPVLFTVQNGLTLWKKQLGMPANTPNGTIATRQACLLQITEKKTDAFAIMAEDDKMVYGFRRLGHRIGGVSPGLEVDALSNLHVLWMSAPRLFEHRVYDRDLQLLQTTYFVADQSAPFLQRDPDIGRVMVMGGRPATPGVDFTLADTDSAASPLPGTAPGTLHGGTEGTEPAAAAPARRPDGKLLPEHQVLGPSTSGLAPEKP
ncbi:MAG: hypothetical protein WC708_19435 [Lentisphaeria bacterium]